MNIPEKEVKGIFDLKDNNNVFTVESWNKYISDQLIDACFTKSEFETLMNLLKKLAECKINGAQIVTFTTSFGTITFK